MFNDVYLSKRTVIDLEAKVKPGFISNACANINEAATSFQNSKKQTEKGGNSAVFFHHGEHHQETFFCEDFLHRFCTRILHRNSTMFVVDQRGRHVILPGKWDDVGC